MANKMDSRYNIKEIEEKIYAFWEKSGYFNPDKLPGKRSEVFSIILPPPNVTGNLHMGHAAMLAIQDILIRYNRMRGRKTLWLPGTDHAAIATQSVVEKELYKKEKKTRRDLGREKFLKLVEGYASKSHDYIISQIKRMGASLDWSREAFTLDEERSLAVRTAFKRMYDEGLIYRGNRIVNWDPKLQTTVSDDEIEWREEKTEFYYLKYGPFSIGTARPETKFGDKYVVMHPDDKRYKKYKHGEKIEVDWINGKIEATIIKDKGVDMKFGTGVMTITPWHDNADFEIAKRHNLDKEQIIDKYGKLLPIAGEFAGQNIKKARPAIVDKLKKLGLVSRIDENYIHRIATNSRGGGVIEPQIMRQWFVGVDKRFKIHDLRLKKNKEATLKELMMEAVKKDGIQIIPKRFEKIYFHWIDNLRDWCVSRQIWYGHRVPVWYCKQGIKNYESRIMKKCGRAIVSVEDVKKCPSCGGEVEQDPDTLDTWFSSGLWTFSTLGWPKKTKDLKTYHPTTILDTGYDLIFFWVARMILMSKYHLNTIPFKTVYFHGLVRDEKGRKMSKSLGNGIDPLEMADKYGADAARMSLIIGTGAGNDVKLSEDKIRGYRNFATKIWNAARFVIMNKPANLRKIEKNAKRARYLKDLTKIKKKVAEHIEKYEFHLAGEKAYHYFWHTFADKIIEAEKKHLYGDDKNEKMAAYSALEELLIENLKMLHPFMPFVTEEIFQKLRPGKVLMIEKW